MGSYVGFRRFVNCQEAIDWGLAYVKKQEEQVFYSEEEKTSFYDTLGALTGSYYRIYNSVLWGDTGYADIEEIMREIEILNTGISSYIIPEDIVVYRATNLKLIKNLFNGYFPIKGTVVKYPAFLHTSLVKRTAWELIRGDFTKYNCVMKIYIVKGSRGIFVDPARTGHLNEQEIILPINCMLEIKKVLPGYYECMVSQWNR